MSHIMLRSLITIALIDTELRAKLLNGERQMVLSKFEFTDQEQQVLNTIQADSLQEFAAKLDLWLQSQKSYLHSQN